MHFNSIKPEITNAPNFSQINDDVIQAPFIGQHFVLTDTENSQSSPKTHWEMSTSPSSNFNIVKTQRSEDAHLSALALTRLLQGSPEEVLSFLSAEQLIELGRNVRKLKRLASNTLSTKTKSYLTNKDLDHFPYSHRLQEATTNAQFGIQENKDFNSQLYHEKLSENDGCKLLKFTYSSRGSLHEYCIRTDINNIESSSLPEPFKTKNCVYPRAMVDRSKYTGNRYEYETSVNEIAWKLTWINLDILAGKRGLIQRAVDSYRNKFNVSRSRRVIRQEKIMKGTLRRRADPSAYQYIPDPALTATGYTHPFYTYPPSTPSISQVKEITVESLETTYVNPVPAIFLSNISYIDSDGKTLTSRIRLDIDSLVEFEEFLSLDPKEHISLIALKDQLANLLIHLNRPLLSSNGPALRAAIDAFKYKILTCDPSRFLPETSTRLSLLIYHFKSLLAPVPSRVLLNS